MDYKITRLTDNPEIKEKAAQWFHEKWSVPVAEYISSMNACLRQEAPVPQWYLALESGKIIGGLGVIENDFHDRADLSPNLCALYVEERYRNRGLARWILDEIRAEAGNMGYDKLWFCMLVAVTLQTSWLSPPVALSAYYIKGALPHWKLTDIYKGMFQYIACQCVGIALIIIFPALATWLPSFLK